MVEPGLTDSDAPVPTKPTPHELEYHCQLAPAPSIPPLAFNVVELPEHSGFTDAEANAAAVDVEFTVTVT